MIKYFNTVIHASTKTKYYVAIAALIKFVSKPIYLNHAWNENDFCENMGKKGKSVSLSYTVVEKIVPFCYFISCMPFMPTSFMSPCFVFVFVFSWMTRTFNTIYLISWFVSYLHNRCLIMYLICRIMFILFSFLFIFFVARNFDEINGFTQTETNLCCTS